MELENKGSNEIGWGGRGWDEISYGMGEHVIG